MLRGRLSCFVYYLHPAPPILGLAAIPCRPVAVSKPPHRTRIVLFWVAQLCRYTRQATKTTRKSTYLGTIPTGFRHLMTTRYVTLCGLVRRRKKDELMVPTPSRTIPRLLSAYQHSSKRIILFLLIYTRTYCILRGSTHGSSYRGSLVVPLGTKRKKLHVPINFTSWLWLHRLSFECSFKRPMGLQFN